MDREPQVVRAQRSGMLIGTRGPGHIEVGDCVALIAQDAGSV